MPRKPLLIGAPIGLGVLVLAGAAMMSRGEPEAKPKRSAPRSPAAAPKAEPIDAPASSVPADAPFLAAPSPSGESPENALIRERIRLLEERLLALQARRDAMVASNQDLEQQIAVRSAEQSARTTAEWRVRAWEQMLGLSETQRQRLIDLCAGWARDDAARPPGRDTWLKRETDLRSLLSVEQAAKLHDTAAQQSESQWKHLGRTIAGMIGAPKEDYPRYQQALGDYRAPNTMLLPEGYGADWNGLMREGSSRLQPMLSADQLAKLNRFVTK